MINACILNCIFISQCNTLVSMTLHPLDEEWLESSGTKSVHCSWTADRHSPNLCTNMLLQGSSPQTLPPGSRTRTPGSSVSKNTRSSNEYSLYVQHYCGVTSHYRRSLRYLPYQWINSRICSPESFPSIIVSSSDKLNFREDCSIWGKVSQVLFPNLHVYNKSVLPNVVLLYMQWEWVGGDPQRLGIGWLDPGCTVTL